MQLKYLMALPLIVALAGCTSGLVKEVTETGPGQFKTNLEVENPALFAKLGITDVKMRRQGDLLNVQATLHHRSFINRDYQYRFKWIDADGFEVTPESSNWRPITLHGHQDWTVEAIAPNPSADKFKIVVREQ